MFVSPDGNSTNQTVREFSYSGYGNLVKMKLHFIFTLPVFFAFGLNQYLDVEC